MQSHFSSHEPKAGILYPSVRRRRPSIFSNDISSEAMEAILSKFYIKYLWAGGTDKGSVFILME